MYLVMRQNIEYIVLYAEYCIGSTVELLLPYRSDESSCINIFTLGQAHKQAISYLYIFIQYQCTI